MNGTQLLNVKQIGVKLYIFSGIVRVKNLIGIILFGLVMEMLQQNNLQKNNSLINLKDKENDNEKV